MAKAKGKVQPVVVEPESPEVALARRDAGFITEWMGKAAQFFTQAKDLEVRAQQTLHEMNMIGRPTNGDEDAHIQGLIRMASADKKGVEAHWLITQTLHDWHRRAVAMRKRATDMLDQAITRGNALHNDYVAEARRKAQEEENRIRREREEQARKEREEELRRLEEAALKAEADSPELSERERQFVRLVTELKLGSVDAAQRAGYKDARATAERFLKTPKIVAAIEAYETAQAARRQAEAVKAQPVAVEAPVVKADVSTRGDRTTWSAEVYDVDAFLAAVLDPVARTRHGIPADVATFKQTALNEYARMLHEKVDNWPGVRHIRKTTVV